jgi:hypothetical protein
VDGTGDDAAESGDGTPAAAVVPLDIEPFRRAA